MSSNSTHQFPSPIGGIPIPIDFAPSVLFSALFACLSVILVWRMAHPRSRTFVLQGTLIFTIERVVAYALRASTAHSDTLRGNVNLQVYLQTTLAGGFISIGQDLLNLVRSLLVGSTMGSDMIRLHSTLTPAHAATKTSDLDLENTSLRDNSGPSSSSHEVYEDHPRMRMWLRRACGQASIIFLVAVILGIIAGVDYKGAIDSGAHAMLVRAMMQVSLSSICISRFLRSIYRYGSAGIGLGLFFLLAGVSVWALFYVPRVPKMPVVLILIATFLLSVVTVYRLDVLRFSTTSLSSTAPGSLNTDGSKAAFYIFHAAPEFLAAAILVCSNARRTFGTGLWGDRKFKDPSPKASVPSKGTSRRCGLVGTLFALRK
ncbi:uncharacterized protein BXZ73DRAFT_103361 [Epithele typhae]|uniref:uncharacterized protein n=1 Tax=Epithele typhae TaxID=378194 RepID=UPI00200864ED|nr:uncharacterized protein BXZ73DRAFT_103361 [Epithele typhae]KAH9924984.1 hypothetical protein BXZ73DRAFT_103361 [Epithele typhae]